MNIGKNILTLRKQKYATQEELAVQLGVTAAAVSKWENSNTLPDIMILCALADYFGVTTDELLGRSIVQKEALVVAESAGLAEQISQTVLEYGLEVVNRFHSFRPALSYAMAHESCRYIFTGGSQELISTADIEETPAEINSIHILGDTDQDILRGLETLCSNLSLFP